MTVNYDIDNLADTVQAQKSAILTPCFESNEATSSESMRIAQES